jgi:hypothetical protein
MRRGQHLVSTVELSSCTRCPFLHESTPCLPAAQKRPSNTSASASSHPELQGDSLSKRAQCHRWLPGPSALLERNAKQLSEQKSKEHQAPRATLGSSGEKGSHLADGGRTWICIFHFRKHRYGDRKALIESEDWTGPAYGTCTRCADVSRSFKTTTCRRVILSFKHHAEVGMRP